MEARLKQSIKEALIRQGIEILKPWLDVSVWNPNVDSDGVTARITFTNSDKMSVVISEVHFHDETGEILQYGSNYGDLVL